jgi:hypothetical protein
MGRTNSTYRNHVDNFIDRFKPFRKALRKENKEYLDKLWEKAHGFAQAGAYMNASRPGLPAIVSMMLGLQKESSENRDKLEELEQRMEELEDGIQG